MKLIACCIALATMLAVPGCHAQNASASAAPAARAAAIAPMQSFTASDGSATAQLPTGWKVTNQSQTVIVMEGPNGDTISLGNTLIAKNAAYTPGKVAGADLAMPYTANLQQKFVMIFQHASSVTGGPMPQVTFAQATPLKAPAQFGECGLFLGKMATADGSVAKNFEAGFCSLPVDSAGIYKNIVKIGEASIAVAAQDRATIEAVLASYQIPMAWLNLKLAPYTAVASSAPGALSPPGGAATAAETAAYIKAMNDNQRAIDIGAQCTALGLTDMPMYRMPAACY